MTARVSLEEMIVHRPSGSTICARCDGAMVITQDAVGRDRLRCERCDGVSKIRRHPDDAMLPQGLVRANVIELPRIEPGQLRCQVCARGLSTNDRFHPECRGAGLLLVQAIRNERNQHAEPRQPGEPRRYALRVCAVPRCNVEFQPTGPASKYCEAHR